MPYNSFPMQKVPMTVKGVNHLRQELERLKTIERPRIAKAIGEARAHGDLRENAEYHAAKEQQGFIEARIRDIEGKLSNANIIDVAKLPRTGIVVFGTTVHVVNIDTNVESVYQLVGDDEADIKSNKISINSPIARALVGKRVGDTIDATTPAGVLPLEITGVRYD
jgi:transcription elongation factor GreA